MQPRVELNETQVCDFIALFGCLLAGMCLANLETPTPAEVILHAPTASPAPNPNSIDITPTYEGCAYVWASHDLPDLSQKVNEALHVIDSNASGSAYAYGEDCDYADGHNTLANWKTDFHVHILVQDLKDEVALGTSIAR